MHSYWLVVNCHFLALPWRQDIVGLLPFRLPCCCARLDTQCSVNDFWWHKQMFVVWKCIWLALISHKLCNMSMFNDFVHPLLLLSEKVPPRLELRSLDSETRVLTITPWNHETSTMSYAWRHMCQFSIISDNSFALTHLNFIMKVRFRALVV